VPDVDAQPERVAVHESPCRSLLNDSAS
jgi:hypothetical protein